MNLWGRAEPAALLGEALSGGVAGADIVLGSTRLEIIFNSASAIVELKFCDPCGSRPPSSVAVLALVRGCEAPSFPRELFCSAITFLA